MSYEPPDIIDPESEAQQLLAETLNDRLNTQLTEGLGLSGYDAMRVLELVSRELESTDTTHLPATSTYRLVPESRRELATSPERQVQRELFEEAVRGMLLMRNITSGAVDGIVDEILSIARDHPPT